SHRASVSFRSLELQIPGRSPADPRTTLLQTPGLLQHPGRETLQLQRLPALLQRQSRLPQQPLDPLVATLLAFPLRQPKQVLLEAQSLLLGLPGHLLEAVPDHRQAQLLQVRQQPLLHVLLHPLPPSLKARRHTTPGPPVQSPPPSVTSLCHYPPAPRPPPPHSAGV